MSDDKKVKKIKKRDKTAAVESDLQLAAESDSVPSAELAATKKASKPSKRSRDAGDSVVDDNTAEGQSAEVEEDDTPALSHKERRLAKKRKLAAEAQGLDAVEVVASVKKPSKKSKTATASADGVPAIGNTPSTSAHGIWVGNMNYATSSKELLAWFEARGLKDVTRINMPGGKRAHEANRGFAYIDFPSETDQTIAVGLSEQHLDGRKLLIKSSSDFTGRPTAPAAALPSDLPASALVQPVAAPTGADSDDRATASSASAPARAVVGAVPQTLNRTARKILDRQKNPAGPTLFLGNLGFETGVEDIRMMFDAHQRAASAWLPKKMREEKEAEERAQKMLEKKASGKEGEVSEDDEAEDETVGQMDVDVEDKPSDEEVEQNAAGQSDSEAESDSDSSEDDEDDDGHDTQKAENGDDQKDESTSSSEETPAEPVKPKRIRVKKKKAAPANADEDAEEKKSKGPKEPLDLTKAKDAGIRKIRLGTFEDTGKCKGWAFVDFHLPEQATRALLNIRNHTLDGRALNVEYASAEAVRRGGLGTRRAGAPGAGTGMPRGGGRGGRGGAERGRGGAGRGRGGSRGGYNGGGRSTDSGWDDAAMRNSASRMDFGAERVERDLPPHRANGGGYEGPPARGSRPPREARPQKEGVPGVRAKPGAALASALRASEGIVKSTGNKITFD